MGEAVNWVNGVVGAGSEDEAFMFTEDGANFQEEIGLEEGVVGAVVGPGAEEADSEHPRSKHQDPEKIQASSSKGEDAVIMS